MTKSNVMARVLALSSDASASREPFRVVCADPPWSFADALPGASRGAEKNYAVLSIDDIRDRRFIGGEFIDHVADDAYLFLWRVAAGGSRRMLTMVEQAYIVARTWGFAPKTEVVWRKQTSNGKRHFGMGHHVRAEHEVCIIAARGKPKPLSRSIRSVFDAPTPTGPNGRAIHSAKPPEFYTEIVEKMYGGPYLELFARSHREGWTCVGNEIT